jgi:hypothetical protein
VADDGESPPLAYLFRVAHDSDIYARFASLL